MTSGIDSHVQADSVAPRRFRVLISAYACEPGKGSEPYVGWNLSRQMAKHHEVWLLTRANNRTSIEVDLARNPVPGLHLVYFDLPKWVGFWKQGRRGIHAYYFSWQVGAYFVARQLHRKVHFDLVHHLTFGIDWVPSFLAFLPIPFVWGPIVGAQSADKIFRRTFAMTAKVQEYARSSVRALSRVDPLMRWAARRTAIGVVSAQTAKERLLSLGFKNVAVLPSVGISDLEIQGLSSSPRTGRSDRIRFLYVGNLLAFKGLSLALTAFAKLHRNCPQTEFWLIGDGPERARLTNQARQLDVDGAVHFWGRLPRRDLLAQLSDCDVLVHLCLRGAISMACLEAMAAGLPVICLDSGGTAMQVSEDSGIQVRALSPDQVVEDLTDAMRLLVENPDFRRRMGQAAQQRVREEFSWNAKGERMREIYWEAIGANCLPAFAGCKDQRSHGHRGNSS